MRRLSLLVKSSKTVSRWRVRSLFLSNKRPESGRWGLLIFQKSDNLGDGVCWSSSKALIWEISCFYRTMNHPECPLDTFYRTMSHPECPIERFIDTVFDNLLSDVGGTLLFRFLDAKKVSTSLSALFEIYFILFYLRSCLPALRRRFLFLTWFLFCLVSAMDCLVLRTILMSSSGFGMSFSFSSTRASIFGR